MTSAYFLELLAVRVVQNQYTGLEKNHGVNFKLRSFIRDSVLAVPLHNTLQNLVFITTAMLLFLMTLQVAWLSWVVLHEIGWGYSHLRVH